jgi:hypothetical protein
VRTHQAPGTLGSAASPEMHAARSFEGQTVEEAQLVGMGCLRLLSRHLARLDTATESYRVELEPLGPSGSTGP